MKILVTILLFAISLKINARANNSCLIEPYFKKTEAYENIILDKKQLILDKDINDISLLPNIYIGTGQQSNNSRSFRSVDESGLHVGISQSIYEGNQYNKSKERINLELSGKNLLIQDKKIDYIIKLLRDVADYRYKIDLRNLYESQRDKQKIQLEVSKVQYDSGEIAAIENEISSHRVREIINNIDRINEEIVQAELDILTKYHIPPGMIDEINYGMIESCKADSIRHLLTKNRIVEIDREKLNYEINVASLKPSISLSLNVSPPDSGSWNDISSKKANFGLSVNASVPLSRFFSFGTFKKKHGISIEKINISYDEKQKLFFREKDRTKSKISELENNIILSKSKLKLKEKELDYMLARFTEKKETILSYYRQFDELEMEKINLKKEERELEYYKAYLYLLD
ncbi:hypothetical protein DFY76_20890 [Escherichia coli]|nr:hypothetical protein [Escherichia coli]MCN2811671.1 TolC family protein [Escherichia coli]HAX2580318.1 TolC family protein [Escherichia coli]HAY0298234.1 TolC family protein [Escherichia coli]